MHHIDEHTLELYALKADEIAGRVEEIEDHLRECHGCRALVEEMVQYYDELKLEMQKLPKTELSTEQAIVRRQIHLKPYYEPFAPRVPYRPNTFPAKMFYFVRRHPVAVMTGSIASFVMVGWLLNDFIKPGPKENVITDKNPDRYTYNSNQNRLEINNKLGQMIWSLNMWDALNLERNESTHNLSYTKIVDLDGDNNKEIATTVDLKNEDLIRRGSFRIYNNAGNLFHKINVDQEIIYNGKKYQKEMYAGAFVIRNVDNSHQKEIIISANNGRSPCKIVRADAEGNILGNYYHYGFVSPVSIPSIINDILLFGYNDNIDASKLSSACIILLDPTKITGNSKSAQASGFSYEITHAEKMYLRILPSKINEFYHINPNIKRILPVTYNSTEALSIFVETVIDNNNEFAYEYIFSADLHLLEIKTVTLIGKVAQQTKTEKKLKGVDTKTYLDILKKEVQYWDGKEWRKEWTMVKH